MTKETNSCCSDNQSCYTPLKSECWVVGDIETPAGKVAVISSKLVFSDKLGAVLVRCAIGRNNYFINPGLYAVGKPTPESPVFVSANYKLSFDCLRSSLGGIDGWVMVIDTKGINVWCAAGKGTFGTDEIVNRVMESKLFRIVSHQKLIVPQLGAPGVSAIEVRKQSGFSVSYGPVRAQDIPKFIEDNFKATPKMREVQFGLRDRVVVIPVELVIWFKQALAVAIALALLSGISQGGYTLSNAPRIFGLVFAGWLTGGALIPALLPWLPGRAFAIKGIWGAMLLWCSLLAGGLLGSTIQEYSGWLLLLSAVVSFMSLNFTGTSTYTSMSGVKKEMKIAIPIQIIAIITGAIFIVWGNVTG